MADWGQRARDKDRDAAIRQINDAAARGQIVDADRDKRVQEVKAAQTVGEIGLLTRGLAAAPAVAAGTPSDPPPTFQQYTPPTTPPVTEADTTNPPLSTSVPPSTWLPSNTPVQYGEPLTSSGGTPITSARVKRSGAGGKLVLILVLCIVAGVALPIFFGIKAVVDGVGDFDDLISDGKADVYSDKGFQEMLEEIEDRTGSTEVWEISMYPDYAVVYVPTQATGKRYIAYRYDGALSEFTKGTRSLDEQRFDLGDLDAGVLRDLRDQARGLVENPHSNYVIVRPPPLGDGPTQVLAYASNDFGETGYLEATINGRVIAKHPPA